MKITGHIKIKIKKYYERKKKFLQVLRKKSQLWAHNTDLRRERGKMLAKLSVSHTQGQKVRYSFDR